MNEKMKNRTRGCLLGVMIGDAAGRTAELRGNLNGKLIGNYTDDTQMAMALAETLVDEGPELDLDVLARNFADHYDVRRCYGGTTNAILKEIKMGTPWHLAVGKHGVRGGSWGNGAAMRVAPIGLYHRWDGLDEQVRRSAVVTGHTHPDAIFYAQILAQLIADLVHHPSERDRKVGAGTLAAAIVVDTIYAIEEPAMVWVREHLNADPQDLAGAIGNGLKASESVPCAIWAFLSGYKDGPEAVVRRAVAIGGDQDTIGSMAGALAGAWFGADAWPAEWVEALENGERGRDFLLGLADDLAECAHEVHREETKEGNTAWRHLFV